MGDSGQARRVGRVQQVAHDATPLHTRSPNVEARIGWLLAMSRLYGDDPRFTDGAVFVRALTEAGSRASRSLVSRWEAGVHPASYDGLAGYEKVLSMQPGTLTGLVGYLRSALSTRGNVPRPALDPTTAAFALRLDDLLERATGGRASAAEWQELGWHFAAQPHVHLRRDDWQGLAETAVSMSARAVGTAQLLVHNAVADLATSPRASDYLIDAVASALADPRSQVVTQPVSLLARIPGPRAGDLVLDIFESPRTPPLIPLSVAMVTDLVVRDQLDDEQRSRLGMQVLRQWRDNPERSSSRLAELIAVLPEGLRRTMTDAADKSGRGSLSYAVEHGEAPAPTPARLSREIAEGARRRTQGEPSHGPDTMLARLVRESLFHRDSERRYLATLILAASPFSGGVCDEYLALLTDARRSAGIALQAAWALRYLVEESHRMRILRLIEHPDELVAGPATLALAHLEYDGVSDQVLGSMLGTSVTNRDRAAMYALGMSGSPRLSGLGRSTSSPEWQRVAAKWWKAQGSAVRG